MKDISEKRLEKEKDKAISIGETLNTRNNMRGIPKDFGMCKNCSNFVYTRSRYGKEVWRCETDRVLAPSKEDPIEECSNFYPEGQLGIREMWDLATMIEVGKNKIGFDL